MPSPMPKILYAYWSEEYPPDEDYMLCDTVIVGCIEKDKKRLVGVYQLKEVQQVELEVKTTVKTKKVKTK